MTIKKALQLTEWLLQNNIRFRKELTSPEMPWNQDDMLKNLSHTLVELTDRDSKVLREIRKEIIGKCKHPKQMHDLCNGQKYCMACNIDL